MTMATDVEIIWKVAALGFFFILHKNQYRFISLARRKFAKIYGNILKINPSLSFWDEYYFVC